MENKVWLSGVVGFELKIFQGGDGLMKTSQREVASEDLHGEIESGTERCKR